MDTFEFSRQSFTFAHAHPMIVWGFICFKFVHLLVNVAIVYSWLWCNEVQLDKWKEEASDICNPTRRWCSNDLWLEYIAIHCITPWNHDIFDLKPTTNTIICGCENEELFVLVRSLKTKARTIKIPIQSNVCLVFGINLTWGNRQACSDSWAFYFLSYFLIHCMAHEALRPPARWELRWLSSHPQRSGLVISWWSAGWYNLGAGKHRARWSMTGSGALCYKCCNRVQWLASRCPAHFHTRSLQQSSNILGRPQQFMKHLSFMIVSARRVLAEPSAS